MLCREPANRPPARPWHADGGEEHPTEAMLSTDDTDVRNPVRRSLNFDQGDGGPQAMAPHG